MDPIQNPFSPGAGSRPPDLVGRDPILEQGRILLGRARQGRSEKSLLLTGLRGVGKTVLLNELKYLATRDGYRTILTEAMENKPLGVLIAPELRRVLYELDRFEAKVKRGLAVLGGFVGRLKVGVGEINLALEVEPEHGTADSGDIEVDLPNLLVAIGEAAADRQSGVALFIDEVQYLTEKELGALIMAMHKIQQERLPVVLIGAGLPSLPALVGDAKSYAERLFSFPRIGALSQSDAAKALQEPAEQAGVEFEAAALDEVFRLTKGYPYFVQEWGYQVWNLADSTPITKELVARATTLVTSRLDNNFFRVRFDRLTPGEKNVLRAMAQLGPSPKRSGDLAELLGIKVTSLAPVRAKLINKGMIYSPGHGELAFTVPLFDEFMIRAIPEFKGAQ